MPDFVRGSPGGRTVQQPLPGLGLLEWSEARPSSASELGALAGDDGELLPDMVLKGHGERGASTSKVAAMSGPTRAGP
jgi:hypothetical protein